jgi:hypothetical protein
MKCFAMCLLTGLLADISRVDTGMIGETSMLSKRPKCIFFATQLLALMVWITQALAGQAQLAWNAPTTNTDGTTLTNLAGYKLR